MNGFIVFVSQQKRLSLFIATSFIIWGLTFSQGIISAGRVWWSSEIFHHCAFVLPISAWLIYEKRFELIKSETQINYFALPFILLLLFVYSLGVAGDIQLFQYIATFGVIPFIFLFFLGYKACLIILFPLFFIIFSIPIGDEIIPILQEITADISVFFLKLVGLPIYRDGLYIDIPNGRFFIAEACSGISFLIVSVVFGCLYTYLSFKTLTKKILFIFLSFGVPILANALRVMGIVIIGDVWGMEYAGGTDHLIYGGVFYCFVLFLLITIGERMKDKHSDNVIPDASTRTVNLKLTCFNSIIVLFFFLLTYVWETDLVRNEERLSSYKVPFELSSQIKSQTIASKPELEGYSSFVEGEIKLNGSIPVEILVAWFNGAEAIDAFSGKQKLMDNSVWHITKKDTVKVGGTFSGEYLQGTAINRVGKRLQFIQFYKINEYIYANKRKAHIHYSWLKLTQQADSVVLVSVMSQKESHEQVNTVVDKLLPVL